MRTDARRYRTNLASGAAAYMLMVKKITVIKIASQTRDSAKYNVSRLISSKSSPGHSVRVDLSQELYPHASASVIGNIGPKRTRLLTTPPRKRKAPVIDDAVPLHLVVSWVRCMRRSTLSAG
jgi:hypothetical protein